MPAGEAGWVFLHFVDVRTPIRTSYNRLNESGKAPGQRATLLSNARLQQWRALLTMCAECVPILCHRPAGGSRGGRIAVVPWRRRQRRSTPTGALPPGIDGGDRRERREGRPRSEATGVDARIARLATGQDGVVTRAQLVELGISRAAIDHRLRTGKLVLVHRGVYAVGHAALSRRGRWRAALMATGENAVLSHLTAAVAWDLIPSSPPFVEVTVTRKGPRSRPGLIVHETQRAPDVAVVDSLPVTAPMRTLRDLKAGRPEAELERMCAEAIVLKHVTQAELDAAGIVASGRAAPTRSALERRFLDLVREAGLPRPLVNEAIGPYLVDFVWPPERVVVETDGWAAHGHRAAFERDHARDADLAARGWLVLRFTWRQVYDAPARVVAQLAQTLASRRSMQGAAR